MPPARSGREGLCFGAARRYSRPVKNFTSASDKLLTLGLVGLGLAHELNSPLTASGLGLELLADRLRGPAPPDPLAAAESVERILGRIRRMAALVDRFRRFAKGEGGRPARVALDAIADEVHELVRPALAETSDIDLLRGSRLAEGEVFVDRILLEQAVAIAVLNAAEAIGDAEGCITLHVCEHVPGWVRLDVDDDGPGFDSISDSVELGYSTKGNEGMGVGLALATRIVESAGGTLEPLNRDEGGARIRICLPLARSN